MKDTTGELGPDRRHRFLDRHRRNNYLLRALLRIRALVADDGGPEHHGRHGLRRARVRLLQLGDCTRPCTAWLLANAGVALLWHRARRWMAYLDLHPIPDHPAAQGRKEGAH